MRIRFLAAVVCLLLAGCSGSDNQPQAAPTTTSTTAPDPAMTACREHDVDLMKRPKEGDAALSQLTFSRDSRIAEAASKVDGILRDRGAGPEGIPPDSDLEYATAELELASACKAAGFLP